MDCAHPQAKPDESAGRPNLAYQSACFTRAAPSGHTPKLLGVLPPSGHLPRGALLVQEIVGRPARLPGDLSAIMEALASIHALALPDEVVRPPLLDPADSLRALLCEVDVQATHLDAANLATTSRAGIEEVRERVRAGTAVACDMPKRLIAFDAHPGNFLMRDNGVAVLVDLEKARYGVASLDVAHATLVTSTTWDVESSTVLSTAEVAGAYRHWALALGKAQVGEAADWVLARAAMWLWSGLVRQVARPVAAVTTIGCGWRGLVPHDERASAPPACAWPG